MPMFSTHKATDNLGSLEMAAARQAADNYSQACKITCRVIDQFGITRHVASPEPSQISICELAGSILPGARSHDSADKSQVCANAHLEGCYASEHCGSSSIYFCPLGLAIWTSPILRSGNVVGALLGGPVHLVDPDDLLIEELAGKNGIHPDFIPELRRKMNDVPIIGTGRVNALSELLQLVAKALSDAGETPLLQVQNTDRQQIGLWQQINFGKTFPCQEENQHDYLISKETILLEQIEMGDKAGTQQILNEILGHIFFSSCGNIKVMRARTVELVVLLSRAAIRGGADVQQIFGLNYACLKTISTFNNIDEIAYWLSGILTRFTDQVFNLKNVKHIDVIYRAVDYIKKNFMDKITLEDTAAYVYLSPAYFSSIFKEETGDKFNAFVNRIRVEGAKKLLLNEKIAMADIPAMVGFDGQSYFSKVFKKLTGITPGKYREYRGKIIALPKKDHLEGIKHGNS